MSRPLLSVVIPTRNRVRLLERVLASLAVQRFPHDLWELIVVDDGATDETPVLVARFAESAPMRTTLLRQRNAGAAAARNAGAAIADGTRLLFLDDDMIASENLVAEHARYAGDQHACVIGGMLPPTR